MIDPLQRSPTSDPVSQKSPENTKIQHPPSPLEDDFGRHNTKKVKTNEDASPKSSVSAMRSDDGDSKSSYKDTLMHAFEDDLEAAVDMEETQEEDIPENKWYRDCDEEANQTPRPYVPGPEVSWTDEEWMDWSKPWKHSLIVKVLGRNINFKVLENKLQKTWARSGTIQVSNMAENYYLVKFVSEDDYNHALFEGPWKVVDHYIVVQRWRKFFSLTAEISKKVVVWIRIPKLPIELCNHRFLWRIGSTLGTMLKVDRLTSIHSRGKFARICVELDLEKQLASHIMLRGTRVNLEYEGLHAICFSCGRYDHKIDNCCERMEKDNNEKTNMDTESADLIVEKTPDIEGSPKGVAKGVPEVKKTLMEQNYG
jgi:hypothetical protein